jgi:hypothetical protein
LELDGMTPPEAIKAADILEKYGKERWVSSMLPDVAAAGDFELSKQIAGHKKIDATARCFLALAATLAGRKEEAQEYVQGATEPLGASKILYVVALQLEQNGDHAAAKAMLLDAIARAKKTEATNMWFPDAGNVRIDEKWHVLTLCYCAAVSCGAGKEVIEQFAADGSIRDIAGTFGSRFETDMVRKWVEDFGRRNDGECERTFALMGLSQGLATAKASDKK